MRPVVFVSGHLDLTQAEFNEHYEPQLHRWMERKARFVMGDARGADTLAQKWLKAMGAEVTVYHMMTKPRNNFEFITVGGFQNDLGRDEAMTSASTEDVAWVRPGREKSGTAKNIERRKLLNAFQARVACGKP